MGKFLPTKDFHVLHITGLSPDDLKQAYKTCDKDKNVFKLNSALNFMIKNFGLTGNISDYTRWYNNKLVPFMEANGLDNYRNLSQQPDSNNGIKFFTYKQIADRLYYSEKQVPYKIFTGHKSMFSYEDGKVFLVEREKENKKYKLKYTFVNGVIYQDIEEINIDFTQYITFKNLTGDVFIEYKDDQIDEYIQEVYTPNIGNSPNMNFIEKNIKNKYYQSKKIETYIDYAKDVKNTMQKFTDDWVEIIKFEDIYFLKASNGDYDFVFKNLRDTPFDTKESFYAPYLKHGDVPSAFNEDYDFQRWLYFGHKNSKNKLKNITINELWEENDRHLAEDFFYKNGGISSLYPGQDNILKNYYKSIGLYQYSSSSNKDGIEMFKKVLVDDFSELYVTDLITIEQYNEFLKDNIEYLKNRYKKLDLLQSVNSEKDQTLPVTVTWYDTLAYCKWIEKKYDIPVRLLKVDEYRLVHPKSDGFGEQSHSHSFDTIKFENYNTYPPYMAEDAFQNLKFSYIKKPSYEISKENISFCIEKQFGEWLYHYNNDMASMIMPYHMGDFRFGVNLEMIKKPYMSASSSGKYKKIKIGFRICYSKNIKNKEV